MNTSLPLNWQRVWTRELPCRIIWNATARTAPYRLQSSSSHFSLPVPLHPLCVSHERNSLTFHVTSCELQTASEWENKHYFQYYIARFNFLDEMRLEPVCTETGPAIRTLFRSVCPMRRQCTHDRTRFFFQMKVESITKSAIVCTLRMNSRLGFGNDFTCHLRSLRVQHDWMQAHIAESGNILRVSPSTAAAISAVQIPQTVAESAGLATTPIHLH